MPGNEDEGAALLDALPRAGEHGREAGPGRGGSLSSSCLAGALAAWGARQALSPANRDLPRIL
jgi:hypothetical protein